ncbi:uncharacterized protein LOC116795981 [Chiroxiphia lanceolata]|uniref:uncharacterized protein LOC116795981 n=1 Tax=Chiroxiphia lanceolata TaxID=296741 RepID=UPI0013CEE29A|nr:uncharacterized protein LOC116795981 [Chiroxiphia lanceolata]
MCSLVLGAAASHWTLVSHRCSVDPAASCPEGEKFQASNIKNRSHGDKATQQLPVSAFPLRPSHRQPEFSCSHTQLCDTWLWEEMWRKCLADLHHRESSTCLEKLLSNRSFVDFRPKPSSATYENSQKERCSTVDQNPESSALWASPTASLRTPVMSLIQIEARLLAQPHNRELSLSSLISVLAKVLRFAPRSVLLPSPTTPRIEIISFRM